MLSRTVSTALVVLAVFTAYSTFKSNMMVKTRRSAFDLGENDELAAEFSKWTEEENKTYLTPAEKNFRLKVFEESNRLVESLKTSGTGFEVTLGKFADLTNEEFLAQRTGLKTMPKALEEISLGQSAPFIYKTLTDIPVSNHQMLGDTTTIDWEERGKLGSVRDQGKCGSCFSFTAAVLTQSHYAIKKSTKVSEISEQHIVDCSKSYGNNGCGGGLIETSLQMAVDIGVMPRSLYPYTAEHMSTCKHDPSRAYKAHTNYAKIESENGKLMAAALNNGPLGIGIDSGPLKHYKSGVITAREGLCGTSVDHAVLLYGMGTYAGGNFWKIRNSWGSDWGENGNFKIHADMDGPGLCGVSIQVCQPIYA